MDDIRRRNLNVFWSEVFSIPRLAVATVAVTALIALAAGRSHTSPGLALLVVGAPLLVVVHGLSAWNASLARRFYSGHLKSLWEGCENRHDRFKDAHRRSRTSAIGGLTELPKTIASVSDAVYRALRRADLVAHEIELSESGLPPLPPASKPASDPQSMELFQVADRNIAEYRLGLEAVAAGVQRSEAQAAVFMTTLDTLRLKMLGHRLVGRETEAPSSEFLGAIAEAKLQLESIDKALDELDMGLYPKMIAVVRPAPPSRGESTVAPSEAEHRRVDGRG